MALNCTEWTQQMLVDTQLTLLDDLSKAGRVGGKMFGNKYYKQ